MFIVARRKDDTLSDTADVRRGSNDRDDRQERPSGTCGQHIPQGDTERRLRAGIGQAGDIRNAPHPDSHRGCEVDEHMESELTDGAKPVSNGGQRNVADTDNTRLEGRDQSGREEGGQRLHLWRHFAGHGDEGGEEGICGERWQNFPSVSPVHRGNDGLPFDVDRLTLSFGKWRTEALKAYGNAIVPQVMYEIFRAIEIVEQHKQP